MTDAFIRKENLDTETQGRRACGDRGRHWNDAYTSQATLRVAANHLEKARKNSSLEPLEVAWPC